MLALPLMAEDDRYTIPGSGGVLRNKRGLTLQEDVDEAMNYAATTRWAIVQTEPILDQLDLEYLRSIHRRFMSPVLGEPHACGSALSSGELSDAHEQCGLVHVSV